MIHVKKKAFSYACFKPYLNYLQLQVCKSLTKIPPGHFSNEQRVSSMPSPWMWNEHRGWVLEPTSFLLPSATRISAAAFQCPQGREGAVLHQQELHTGVSTPYGDLLRVAQRFRAAADTCVNVVAHSLVPCPLATSPWAVAGAGTFAGLLKQRALWTAQASRGQSCGQSAYSGIPPDTKSTAMTSNPFFHKKVGGGGKGSRVERKR